jgi:AcrR family transcriptional regulator
VPRSAPTTDGHTPVRPRDRNRREKILRAAARLFRERGFHAVGIDEIGTAAGITGPGVYRHFSGKDELLVRVLEDATGRLWELGGDGEPRSLDDFVRAHVAFALEHGDAIELWERERRHLPDDAEQAQRRWQRRYVQRWADLLLEQRPDLTTDEARLTVLATLALIHSARSSRQTVPADRVASLLEDMALAALRA